ncbi:late embryogenesis abundant protein, LEA-25/LEA-D113 [Artemisia annua]|uniref:Late embryogenesis abundant protein, LEA-25/LEA-D113 n=1 Tax=Artemisia annua TaxID=35608 RepID=A0A2U1MS76_ARTAN|nr:late embryogenesis abundant protein, LEA-25/LEA-D113 [Artemisia annua]
MQTIKDKVTDFKATSKVRSEAKQEEKAEKELAKSRVEVAHEIRLAREAEASMDAHVNKAMEKAAQHDAKLAPDKQQDHGKADGLTSHHGTAKSDSTNHSDGNSSSNIPEHLSKFM